MTDSSAASNFVEQRRFERKSIRLSCHLQLDRGLVAQGYTQNLSNEGVFMATHDAISRDQRTAVKIGGLGILTLQYTEGDRPEVLKVRCRVAHITANGIGIFMFTSLLSSQDQDVITRILDTGSSQLQSIM